MTVSGPTVTSESMTQVSGRKMVTPWAIRRLARVHAHGGVEVHHLGDGVRAEDFIDTVGLKRDYAEAVGDQHGGDVGEVELAVGVVGGEGIEAGEECFGLEAVDAGVDLWCAELVRLEGFLLDDGGDFGAMLAGAKYAAVAGGVRGHGGEDGHRGASRADAARRATRAFQGG